MCDHITDNPTQEIPYGYCHCGCGQLARSGNRFVRNHHGRRPLKERFWEKVEKGDGCWNWKAGCGPGGYGTFTVNDHHEMAHRMSWILCIGSIPQGMKVLHRCDNPRCVNPEHLFLGTQTDNMQDMVKKGRQRLKEQRGEHNTSSMLTADQVRDIRRQHKAGELQTVLARQFGVSKGTIWDIVHYKTWTHLP